MRRLVGDRHQPAAGGDLLGPPPQRRVLDGVDAVAPGVPAGEPGLVQAVGELQAVELASGEVAHLVELRLDRRGDVGGERAPQVGAQERVVAVLIAESRRALAEGHRVSDPSLSGNRGLGTAFPGRKALLFVMVGGGIRLSVPSLRVALE